MIKIHLENTVIEDCSSIIIVPEKALEEAGYIKTLADQTDASSKHEFHTMAQMAYFQYQDDEISVNLVKSQMKVETDDSIEVEDSAMLLFRNSSGAFHVYAHQGLNIKKMLETAYRYCTRWVRLDI